MSPQNVPPVIFPFRETRAFLKAWRYAVTRALVKKLVSREKFRRWEFRQARKLFRRSRFFDKRWYVAQNPDLTLAEASDPVLHYLSAGACELRDPSAKFNTLGYLKQNGDFLASGMNPLYHYLVYGRWKKAKKRKEKSTATGGKMPEIFARDQLTAWLKELDLDRRSRQLMQAAPLVSIIMPTRNRSGVISKAVSSLVAQVYPHWELWVVDDGGTDSTAAVLRGFGDDRIHYVKTGPRGVCAARNTGLERASGEYIAYLDSDNVWSPEYLLYQLCALDHTGADCSYAVLKVIDQEMVWYRQMPFDYERLKLSNYIDLNVFIHRRRLFEELGGFDEKLKRMVDWDFILRYTRGRPVSYAPFIGTLYDNRPAPDRISSQQPRSWLYVVRNKYWVDWEKLRLELSGRDSSLVSIVICVYGQLRLLRACLASLFTHEAGEKFEVIVVNNDPDRAQTTALENCLKRFPGVRLVRNPENFNFALGNNVGFQATRGTRVVFLNSDTEVSPEWLRALVRPLEDPAVKAAQPKLLYPNGTIAGAGLVFSSRSALAYPIYLNQPGDFPPTQKPRDYAAITAACIALRAGDFIRARGFDPIFVNGQEDVDLCLRLGGGKAVFRYAADSIVFHHEGMSPGRGRHVRENRAIFKNRWQERVRADDGHYYHQDAREIEFYVPDHPDWAPEGTAAWRPKLAGCEWEAAPVASDLAGRVIAIKIPCLKAGLKDQWGDYHFAVSLAAAFARKGVRSRIDFLQSWEKEARVGDINLVLRGLSRFIPRPETLNLLWIISHPDQVDVEEMQAFDHVFAASELWAGRISRQEGVPVEPLLQCTDVCRFFPRGFSEALHSQALFVANSRKVQRLVIQQALAEGVDSVDIYGTHWQGFAPRRWVKAERVDNIDLPRLYSSADVVLNDHWPAMRQEGFVSNRVFDVLACGAPLVTDSVEGLPAELAPGCHFFDQGEPLGQVIEAAHRNRGEISPRAREIAGIIRRKHTFDQRAARILEVVRRGLPPTSSKPWKPLLVRAFQLIVLLNSSGFFPVDEWSDLLTRTF